MLISTLLSLGSIVLGLIAWIVPCLAMGNSSKDAVKKCSYSIIISLSACIISICLQFYEINYRVKIHDWSALMDTMGALIWVATILAVSTIILNMIALVTCFKKERQAN